MKCTVSYYKLHQIDRLDFTKTEMLPSVSILTLSSLVIALGQAVSIPSNVQRFYDGIVAQGSCNNRLQTGFYSTDGGSGGESLLRLQDMSVYHITKLTS